MCLLPSMASKIAEEIQTSSCETLDRSTDYITRPKNDCPLQFTLQCLKRAIRNVDAAIERVDLRKEYIKLFSIASNNSQVGREYLSKQLLRCLSYFNNLPLGSPKLFSAPAPANTVNFVSQLPCMTSTKGRCSPFCLLAW